MAIDSNLFKISFLVGDIVSRRIDGHPLPVLSREDHMELRRQLFKEITKLGQLHISQRGAAYKNLTDRIAESAEYDEKCSRDACTQIEFDVPATPCREHDEEDVTEIPPHQVTEPAYDTAVPDLTNDILLELLSQASDIVRSRSSSSARSEWSDNSTITTSLSDSTIIGECPTQTTSRKSGATNFGYGSQSVTTFLWIALIYGTLLWISGTSLASQAVLFKEGVETVRNIGGELAVNGLAALDPVAEGYLAWRKQS